MKFLSDQEYEKCKKDILDDFYNYDQYVNVVSCWESFLEYEFSSEFDDFYFDRFPSLSVESKQDDITPDFSVLFNEKYGIIFEITRTMPKSSKAFDGELEQIKKYDNPNIEFKSQEQSIIPSKHDIVLLVSQSDSMSIRDRIYERLNEGLVFNNNLALMEYTLVSQDREEGYQFRRFPKLDNLRDDVLPEGKKFSKKFSRESNGYGKVFVKPGDFFENKSIKIFCNDSPPAIYFSCFLWQRVFYSMLESSQVKRWIREGPKKTMPIEVEVEDLRDKINSDFVPGATFRKNDVRRALDFLEVCGLAEKVERDIFSVNYRRIQRKQNKFRDNNNRVDYSNLADILAEYYCQKKVKGEIEEESSEGEEEKEERELSQSDFGEF